MTGGAVHSSLCSAASGRAIESRNHDFWVPGDKKDGYGEGAGCVCPGKSQGGGGPAAAAASTKRSGVSEAFC